MSYAIHNQNLAFNDSAVAQYMNTDFIVLDIALCVALAREQFFKKLKDDDIPSHILLKTMAALRGWLPCASCYRPQIPYSQLKA